MTHLRGHSHPKPSAGTVNLLAALWHLGQISITGVSENRGGRCRRLIGGCCTFPLTIGGDDDYSARARQGRKLRLLQTAA